jgi:hypothetical protein
VLSDALVGLVSRRRKFPGLFPNWGEVTKGSRPSRQAHEERFNVRRRLMCAPLGPVGLKGRWSMPISIADRPRIAEAVADLIRAIESFAHEGGSVALSERLKQAKEAILAQPGDQANPARNADILNSQLDLSERVALHKLWMSLKDAKLWAYTIPNTPELALDELKQVLTVLRTAGPRLPKVDVKQADAAADSDAAAGEQADGRGSHRKARRRGAKTLKEKAPIKYQVYERIQREHQAGEQSHDTIERLKRDRQFLEQVQEAKLSLNPKLVRNALAYFATQSRRNNQQIPPTG